MPTLTARFIGAGPALNLLPEQVEDSRRDRIEAWPAILRASLQRHLHTPFVWGASDCGFVFDFVRDATGFDPFDPIRGNYSDEATAFRAVRSAGYANMLEFVASNFVEIPPEFARRGDIGYPADIPHALMSPAIIDGAFAFSKQPAGGVIVPRHLITRAWAV